MKKKKIGHCGTYVAIYIIDYLPVYVRLYIYIYIFVFFVVVRLIGYNVSIYIHFLNETSSYSNQRFYCF